MPFISQYKSFNQLYITNNTEHGCSIKTDDTVIISHKSYITKVLEFNLYGLLCVLSCDLINYNSRLTLVHTTWFVDGKPSTCILLSSISCGKQ